MHKFAVSAIPDIINGWSHHKLVWKEIVDIIYIYIHIL